MLWHSLVFIALRREVAPLVAFRWGGCFLEALGKARLLLCQPPAHFEAAKSVVALSSYVPYGGYLYTINREELYIYSTGS